MAKRRKDYFKGPVAVTDRKYANIFVQTCTCEETWKAWITEHAEEKVHAFRITIKHEDATEDCKLQAALTWMASAGQSESEYIFWPSSESISVFFPSEAGKTAFMLRTFTWRDTITSANKQKVHVEEWQVGSTPDPYIKVRSSWGVDSRELTNEERMEVDNTELRKELEDLQAQKTT